MLTRHDTNARIADRGTTAAAGHQAGDHRGPAATEKAHRTQRAALCRDLGVRLAPGEPNTGAEGNVRDTGGAERPATSRRQPPVEEHELPGDSSHGLRMCLRRRPHRSVLRTWIAPTCPRVTPSAASTSTTRCGPFSACCQTRTASWWTRPRRSATAATRASSSPWTRRASWFGFRPSRG